MTRTEAETTAGVEDKLYRPLSIGTMALLQQLGSRTLAALLGGTKLEVVDYEDFVVFLWVHSRDHSLGDVREAIRNGDHVQKAYDWVDDKTPMDIAQGVDYFTGTQTRAQLVAATGIKEHGSSEKKTSLHQNPSHISRQSSGTTSTSAKTNSTTPPTPESSSSSTQLCSSTEPRRNGKTKTKRKPKKTSK